jgi:hypothetical protein
MYKYVINNIIAADDLHWSEEEGKYVSLSREEIDDIISSCLQQDMTNLDEIMKVIGWCGSVRVGQILWKNFLAGSLKISGFDDNNEPRFTMKGTE